MCLVDHALQHFFLSFCSSSPPPPPSLSLSFSACLSVRLSFSLSVSPPIHGDRGRNYYFLTSTKRLILQRSIYRTLRWHRTSANGTANDCVLLVPLHLPHYTQFSAGDLIGFSQSSSSFSHSFLFPSPPLFRLFYSPLPFACAHSYYRSEDHFLSKTFDRRFWNCVI